MDNMDNINLNEQFRLPGTKKKKLAKEINSPNVKVVCEQCSIQLTWDFELQKIVFEKLCTYNTEYPLYHLRIRST